MGQSRIYFVILPYPLIIIIIIKLSYIALHLRNRAICVRDASTKVLSKLTLIGQSIKTKNRYIYEVRLINLIARIP